ncbi:MAG TPA: hypothetical protein VGK73_29770 [Polyangiaceae bacterium]
MTTPRQFRTICVFTLGASILLGGACGRSKRSFEGTLVSAAGSTHGGGDGGSEHGAGGASAGDEGGGDGGRSGEPAAGDGGDGGGDGGAGGEFGEQDCSLPPLAGDAKYTWDAGVVALRVHLTLNGAPFPDSPSDWDRGSVILRNRRTMTGQSLHLGPRGDATLSALAFAGNYDVLFTLDESGAIAGMRAGGGARLATDLAIDADTELAFDLQTVEINGTLTVNGESVPESPVRRGVLEFRDPEAESHYYVDVGPSGATFDVKLFAGSYDVTFTTSSLEMVELPYSSATRLATGVRFDRPASVSYDLKPVDVSVALTSAGGALPDSEDAFRGHVVFRDRLTSTQYRFDVGASGPTAFGGRLFAGSYDVTFVGGGELPASFPIAGLTRLAAREEIGGGEMLSYDLTPVTVGGAVSLNGARMPDNPDALPRGSVSFRDADTGKVYDFDVGASGDALYSGVIFAGTYDVSFKTNLVHQPGLPFGGSPRLERGVVIDGPRSHDYDLRVVEVSGNLTSHGGDLPDSPDAATRGLVTFHDSLTRSSVAFDIGKTGPARYSGLLHAGSYDVSFDTATDDELVELPSGTSTRLAEQFTLTSDRVIDYDVRPIRIEGAVTVNGRTMPESPDALTRGVVALRDKFTNTTRALELDATGAAEFSALVFDGSYDVALATADDQLVGLPANATTLLATGCLELGRCDAGTDELSGTWTFVFDLAGWGPLVVELQDVDGALSGPFVSPTDSGSFESGSREGNELTLSADLGLLGCVPLTLHATLFSACGVSGYASCGGFSSYSPRFTGYR